MTVMRQLIYYVAATLDGYIAHEDGSLEGFPWDEEYGKDLASTFPETFPVHLRRQPATREENRRFDAVLMGRKTWEVGLREGITSPYPTLDQFVFSRTMREPPASDVALVSANPVAAVAALKRRPGKAIWLCGGGTLASILLGAGLIDGLIVKLNPVLFGAGIPLFAGPHGTVRLRLTDSTVYASGHAVLYYTLH